MRRFMKAFIDPHGIAFEPSQGLFPYLYKCDNSFMGPTFSAYLIRHGLLLIAIITIFPLIAVLVYYPIDSVRAGLVGLADENSTVRPTAIAAVDRIQRGESGFPLPRFVTIRTDAANARIGPSRQHEIKWVYQRRGLPLEILAEYGNWRRIRDWDDHEAWVHSSQLSGARRVLVRPAGRSSRRPRLLRHLPERESPITLRVEPGSLMVLLSCSGDWCKIGKNNRDGWLRRDRIWGVYADEIFP